MSEASRSDQVGALHTGKANMDTRYRLPSILANIPTKSSQEQKSRTSRGLWYNNFNFRQPFEAAARVQAEKIPNWDTNLIPKRPWTEQKENEALIRKRSGRQNQDDPLGMTEETLLGNTDSDENNNDNEANSGSKDYEDKEDEEEENENEESEEPEDNKGVHEEEYESTNGTDEERDPPVAGSDSSIKVANRNQPPLPRYKPTPMKPLLPTSARSNRNTRGLAQISRSSKISSRAKASPPRKSPFGQKTQPATEENTRWKLHIAKLHEDLANAKAELAAEKKEVERLQEVVENPIDTFPWSFWPPLPWDSPPSGLVTPPHVWRGVHKYPERREEYAWEGKNQYSKRKRKWAEDEAANKRKWLGAGLHARGDGTTWHGVRFLGAGSYGSAGLWVKVDENKNITDHMVGKECIPRPADWYYPGEWRGRLPREIHMHQAIESTRSGVSHRSVIQHRGYRLMMRKKRYRVYLDLCSGGALYGAMYDKFNPEPGKARMLLPEPFIWHVFRELVDGCLILQQGSLSAPVQGWKPMVHNDLHINNIFLDKRRHTDTSIDPVWPRIVVADFGRTFYELNTSSDAGWHERDNPKEYRLPADDPRFPYEAQLNCLVDIKITEKTDVWMIGSIIFSLISHVYTNQGPILEDGTSANTGEFENHRILQGTKHRMQSHYSETIKEWVTRCLQFKAHNRPSLVELRRSLSDLKPSIIKAFEHENSDPGLNQEDLSEFDIGKKHRPAM